MNPATQAVKKSVRLVMLLRILGERGQRGISTRELAEMCGVSQRTIQQDLQDLQAEPIYAPLILRVRREWVMEGKPASNAREDCG